MENDDTIFYREATRPSNSRRCGWQPSPPPQASMFHVERNQAKSECCFLVFFVLRRFIELLPHLYHPPVIITTTIISIAISITISITIKPSLLPPSSLFSPSPSSSSSKFPSSPPPRPETVPTPIFWLWHHPLQASSVCYKEALLSEPWRSK